jgi:hypothetical protein
VVPSQKIFLSKKQQSALGNQHSAEETFSPCGCLRDSLLSQQNGVRRAAVIANMQAGKNCREKAPPRKQTVRSNLRTQFAPVNAGKWCRYVDGCGKEALSSQHSAFSQ